MGRSDTVSIYTCTHGCSVRTHHTTKKAAFHEYTTPPTTVAACFGAHLLELLPSSITACAPSVNLFFLFCSFPSAEMGVKLGGVMVLESVTGMHAAMPRAAGRAPVPGGMRLQSPWYRLIINEAKDLLVEWLRTVAERKAGLRVVKGSLKNPSGQRNG